MPGTTKWCRALRLGYSMRTFFPQLSQAPLPCREAKILPAWQEVQVLPTRISVCSRPSFSAMIRCMRRPHPEVAVPKFGEVPDITPLSKVPHEPCGGEHSHRGSDETLASDMENVNIFVSNKKSTHWGVLSCVGRQRYDGRYSNLQSVSEHLSTPKPVSTR